MVALKSPIASFAPVTALPPVKIRLRALLRDIKFSFVRRYRAFKFSGQGVECNLCGKEFGTFMPTGVAAPVLEENSVVGGGYRENARCPWCESVERTRLILHYLTDEAKLFSGKRFKVLHVAPEIRMVPLIRKFPFVDLLTVDLYRPYVDECMDILNIQKPDDSFDVILCSHVLEHVDDDLVAMREIKRVLKPGGFAIVQVPISFTNPKTLEDSAVLTESERLEKFGQIDHVRLYGQDYFDRLESAGFSVEKYLPVSDVIKKIALNPKELLFVVRSSDPVTQEKQLSRTVACETAQI